MQQNTLRFRVHSNVPGTEMKRVIFEGQEVEASVPNAIVELAWDSKDNRDHGSLTLKFAGGDMAWARDTFVQDGEVDLSFSPVKSNE